MNAVRRVWGIIGLPVVSIAVALALGAVVIVGSDWLISGELRFELVTKAYGALISGSLGNENAIINSLRQSATLILGGLSVGLAFKAGLFNIGAYGQFLVGALAAVAVGTQFREFEPGFVGMLAALVAGIVGGAVWGFIPGILKALSGAHEVVTTIMLNAVAVSTVAAVVSTVLAVPGSPSPITLNVGTAELPTVIGKNGHLGLIYAPLFALAYGWLLYRTTWGFEIRTAGANPDAARYAGMSPRLIIVATMTLAGGLAGFAGATELLGITKTMTSTYNSTVGWDSIAVALLGRSNPLGIVLAALLFGTMRAGSGTMQALAGVPAELVGVLQGTILLVIVANVVIQRIFRLRAGGGGFEEATTITRTYGGEAKRV